MMIVELSDI